MSKTTRKSKPAASRKHKPAAPGSGAADPRELVLAYNLADLPSSQHRAGLAGLVLMCDWLDRNPEARRGTCELTRLDARGATLRIDREGLAALLDQVYGAELEERAYPRPFRDTDPLRTETRVDVHARTGKTSEKTLYVYPVVVPRGAYLAEWDSGPWRKLWRDMLWSILRGVPATRAPFEARAHARSAPDAGAGADADADPDADSDADADSDPDSDSDAESDAGAGSGSDSDALWLQLLRPGATVELPSTYFLGAQARTADNVGFRDLARHQLLLHFWPFVAQIYVPAVIDTGGKQSGQRDFRGYALAVPDIACLDDFCHDLPPAMRERPAELDGYLPAAAVIDLAVESALDLMLRLQERVRRRESESRNLEVLHGVDVFHVAKEGNNVRILGSARVDVDPSMLDDYQSVRRTFRSHLFRRQYLLNLVHGRRPWHSGFDRIAATVPTEQTIESTWFCADARRAFELCEEPMNHPDNTPNPGPGSPETKTETDTETGTATEASADKRLEPLIYRLVGSYVAARLESKHGIAWKDEWRQDRDHKDPAHREYRDKRLKIAKDAFLAIRSRTGPDFVDYFSGTICAGFQRMSEADYAVVARALLASPESTARARTLTLLALSARA